MIKICFTACPPLRLATLVWLFGLLVSQGLKAEPSVEDFGHLPTVRSLTMSPSGQHYAWLQQDDGKQFAVVHNTQDGSVVAIATGDQIKNRALLFATEEYVILQASTTKRFVSRLKPLEYSGAYSFNIKTQKSTQLLRNIPDLYLSQSSLGTIVGVHQPTNTAFMPGWDTGTKPRYNLYKVDLETGKGRLFAQGSWRTNKWFVDSQGELLAREDFDYEIGLHTIHSYTSGKAREIYRAETDRPKISLRAVAKNEQQLLFVQASNDTQAVFSLDLNDGKVEQTIAADPNKEIDQIVTDINRQFMAVKYSGFQPSYHFPQPQLEKTFDAIQAAFPSSSVDFLSSSANNQHFLVQVSGNSEPNAFYTFDDKKQQLRWLTKGYRNLSPEHLGEVIAFRYKARDGLKIPAILTWPSSSVHRQEGKNLPLIVLPHGGPDSYNAIGFDWLAQFLANKGYLVLQPNFRGSTGFGNAFYQAGKGRWGQEMQNDVTDGVNYLVERGLADKSRVCILGASYGGYSALAGGAFTPDLYRCVVAINGVSDIHEEIKRDIRDSVQRDWLVTLWEDVFDGDKKEFKKLDQVSPVFFADRFKAPTLIIYSEDDTVVAPRQSKKMHKALKKAGKNSSLEVLKDEDHWHSNSETRIQLLRIVEGFLDQHNPIH